MYIIDVIPLKRAVQVETLSYFSSENYPIGGIVTIPIRQKEILGLITSVREVSSAKTALRAATFSLKKIPPQTAVQTLSPAYIETAKALALRYPATLGAIIFTLLAPEIRTGERPLPHTHHPSCSTDTHAPELLQAPREERFLEYRSLIRETFAHGGSVLLVAPTSAEASELHAFLSTGIEERTILLTSGQTKKNIREAFTALEDFSKSKCIITTPNYALIERHDITLTILDAARSAHLKERSRPYLDYRDVCVLHAKYAGRRIILGDILPRSEEEYARRSDIYQTVTEPPRRIALPGTMSIVQMKDKTKGDQPFRLFSPKVVSAIEASLKAKGHVFLFTARRGLAPAVVCMDCGYLFRSPNTGGPFSLIRTKKDGVEQRWFVCSSSGHRERAADTCPECTSWRLRERGIGIQHVHDELRSLLPRSPITLFDHTTASTYKKAMFLRDTFFNTKGSIMLGTSMAVPYLTAPINTSVVVNMDALSATPTWRLQEENLALLLRLREQTTGTVYVQTRSEPDELLAHAKRGTVEKFYDEELELRKTFNYPPFTVFIHLTWQGTAEAVAKTEALVVKILEIYTPTLYSPPPAPSAKGQPQCTRYALIRIAARDWPNEVVIQKLRSLPPVIRTVINPDRIV